MIILIGSEKGGVGKSTLATNLSALLVTAKKDVVLVDADRQSTSAIWHQDRLTTDKPKFDCIRLYDNISQTIKGLGNRYDFVIVDCQGRDSKELRSGLVVADLVLFPFRPSQFDLYTLPNMVEMLTDAQLINPSLVGKAVITMSPTNPQVNELENARGFFADFDKISLLNTVICDRKVYRDAGSLGLSVIEMDNEKATHEINALWEELKNGV
jgi:chromosome partitioning protein